MLNKVKRGFCSKKKGMQNKGRKAMEKESKAGKETVEREQSKR